MSSHCSLRDCVSQCSQHDTADDVRGSVSTRPETTRQQLPDSTTPSMVSDRDKLKAKLKAYLDKKAKSKKSVFTASPP